MAQFEYRATDSSGRVQSGTIDAASANDAVAILSRQGLILQSLNTVSPVVVGRGLQPIILNPTSPSGSSGPVGTVSSVAAVRTPRSTAKPRLTGFFKDHDQWLLMSQFGSILRSGMTPHDMLRELSQRQSLKPKVRHALTQMATWTGQGMPLSDAMAGYPEIFSPGSIGSVRAGEHGGYLAEACTHSSEQIQSGWRLRRVFAWTVLAIWTTLLMIPFIPIMKRGGDALIGAIDGGPDQDFVGIFLSNLAAGFTGIGGVLLILFLLIWFIGPRITGRLTFLPIRHRLAATMPILKRRTRLESAQELTFHLERLSAAGNSPLRSFQLAAEAVPNVVHRDALVRAGQNRREDVPYSALIPPEWISPDYINLIATGEMTGTAPQAFEQVRRLSEGERQSVESHLKLKAWIWVFLFTMGFGAIIFAVMYRQFYDSVFRAFGV